MAKKIKIPQGCVLLRHADPTASASWNGVAYDPTDGYIVVPGEAAADLASHGFVLDGDVDQDPAPEAAPEPAAPESEPEPEA